jgi:hypothetical protein
LLLLLSLRLCLDMNRAPQVTSWRRGQCPRQLPEMTGGRLVLAVSSASGRLVALTRRVHRRWREETRRASRADDDTDPVLTDRVQFGRSMDEAQVATD